MKKLVSRLTSLVLTSTMVFTLAGCGGTDTADSGDSATTDLEGSETATTDWPSGPITVNVAAKAGGGTDLYTRLITTPWQQSLDESVAVVNFDNAAVAYQTTANEEPDGQTLLAGHPTLLCSYVTGATDVNPMEDLSIVAAMQDMGSQVLVVPPDAPYDDFNGFVEYAKEHPGELVAGIQTGGSSHFMCGLIEQEAGIDLKFVEAANETDKLTNVAGGFLDLGICTVANSESYENDGKVKVIGVINSSGENIEGKPSNWDTLQNQGYPNISWGGNIYLFAPGGTDEATLEAINASLEAVLDDETYNESTITMGGIPEWHNLEESREMLQEQFDNISEIGSSLGISVIE